MCKTHKHETKNSIRKMTVHTFKAKYIKSNKKQKTLVQSIPPVINVIPVAYRSDHHTAKIVVKIFHPSSKNKSNLPLFLTLSEELSPLFLQCRCCG